jgi:hypothetical protein
MAIRYPLFLHGRPVQTDAEAIASQQRRRLALKLRYDEARRPRAPVTLPKLHDDDDDPSPRAA